MPSVYDLKPKFQSLLRPLSDALVAAGVTANAVTIFAMLLSVASGAAIYRFHSFRILLILPLVLFLRMALNAIDGMIAREHNQKTALGAILNELGDVFADAALYLPLAFVPFFSPTLIIGVVLLAILSEMTGVVGVQIGASRRYDGPMGKSDRAFIFGTLGLLLGLNLPIGPVVFPALAVMLILLCVTIFNRARGALRELQARGTS
jgi:CDP-diacylglycerol---glycerol-3-phosphate 3-phosphatidyltransferase